MISKKIFVVIFEILVEELFEKILKLELTTIILLFILIIVRTVIGVQQYSLTTLINNTIFGIIYLTLTLDNNA